MFIQNCERLQDRDYPSFFCVQKTRTKEEQRGIKTRLKFSIHIHGIISPINRINKPFPLSMNVHQFVDCWNVIISIQHVHANGASAQGGCWAYIFQWWSYFILKWRSNGPQQLHHRQTPIYPLQFRKTHPPPPPPPPTSSTLSLSLSLLPPNKIPYFNTEMKPKAQFILYR